MNRPEHPATGPLTGYRVVDFSGYVAGPTCTMLLGDLGAEVIKVESPTGEQWRHQDPFGPLVSRSFLALNRNKRSVALNLKQPEGVEAARRLVATADVMVHNFRPGTERKLGLDYDTLSRINPGLVYAYITAYGEGGPRSGQPGYDLVVQALSGLLAANPSPDGGVPRRYAGVALVDFTAGYLAAIGILGALVERTRTGRGQQVTSSLLHAALGLQRQKLLAVEAVDGGPVPPAPAETTRQLLQQESERANAATARELYYRTYQTSDGFLAVGCLNRPQRLRLLELLHLEDPWHLNPDQLPSSPEEDQARRELAARAEALFRQRSTAEWLAALEAADVPCTPVRVASEVFHDPQVRESGALLEFDYPGYGRVTAIATGVRVGAAPIPVQRPPLLGEHTRSVLAEIGYDEQTIAEMEASGVAVSPERKAIRDV